MEYKIAFVGNPNVGKSAWINALSHADFKVGNWPGVTIEKKEAQVTWGEDSYHLIDLPGTYALDDATNEEKITTAYLRKEAVDLIVNVVDATNLSRNLYLTLRLRELQIPMILILNFMDEVEKYGIQIEVQKLSRRLQLPVLPYSALDKAHYKDVKKAIQMQASSDVCFYPLLEQKPAQAYAALCTYLEQQLPQNSMHAAFVHRMAVLLIQQDEIAIKQMAQWHISLQPMQDVWDTLNPQYWDELHYQGVLSLLRYVKQEDAKRLKITRKIDRILLHRYFGLPLCIVIFSVLLCFIFNGSAPWNDMIDFFINGIVSKYAAALTDWLPAALQQLIQKGIIAGAGGVLTFIPLMTLLYLSLSLLEESGYMSRIAYLLDQAMRNFHLSGKSFVSLLLGFGCNVPAVYATRTLDNEKQKKLTALLVPFMSCGARLPVYVLFAAAFFKGKAAWMILSVYGIGILMALLLALLFSRSKSWKDDALFVLELPPYRIPNMQVVWNKVKQEVLAYIKKAVGIVLWAMIILWSLSYFPNGRIQDSYIASFAKHTSFLFEPLGFGTRWESVAALPGSIIAKETVVGFFDQVLLDHEDTALEAIDPKEDVMQLAYEFGRSLKKTFQFLMPQSDDEEKTDDSLITAVSTLWKDRYASLRAFSFMVYLLLSIPCIMTLQAIYREYGKRLLLTSIAAMTIIPYLTALFIFQIFCLFY